MRPAISVSICFAILSLSGLLAADRLKSVEITGIPHVLQKPDFCGEACAEMWLRKLGQAGDQDYVYDKSGLDPLLGRGCYTKELTQSLKAIGFKVGEVYTQIPVATAEASLQRAFATLHADLHAGVPSIVCTHFDERPDTTEHFRLVLGYDAGSDEIIYHDPALKDGKSLRMSRAMLLKLWPLKYAADTWTLVRIRLEPGKVVPLRTTTAPYTDADYAQHIMALRERLPHKGFSVVIQKPFVVVGDEPLKVVQRRSQETVKWAVDRLKKDYFTEDPVDIIDIWLFRDAPSYEEGVKKLTGRDPGTPFGFYTQVDKGLFMNISTGGGTLVHEIVHPFMSANFPECPSWFNEGLASLYEQSSERDGRIIGLTNWRLAGLQEAIREGTVPPFQTLCGTTTRQFYDQDKGTNYAQARYLCYHLQERGLLKLYYQTFRKNCETDPTGYETLKSVLRQDDMEKFQKNWEAEVLELRFP